MISANIPVIDSFEAVLESSMRIYRNELPGFQISPGYVRQVGLVAIIDAVDQVGAQHVSDSPPILDDVCISQRTISIPHIDGGWKGLAIHYNRIGHASLALAHLARDDESAADDFNIKPQDLNTPDKQFFSYMLTGKVRPGVVTIFSEGNIVGLKPTAHQFSNPDGTNRCWVRIASTRYEFKSPDDSERIRAIIENKIPDLPAATSTTTPTTTGEASSAESA